jgi:hypothetical protein
MSQGLPRGAYALLVGLPVVLSASAANAAVYCCENFEGTQCDSVANCGTWTPQMSGLTSEWSKPAVDSNTSYDRIDNSGTTGKWNDSMSGQSYGDATVSVNVRINSWNSTGSDQAAIYTRWHNDGNQYWYSLAIASDGKMHIRKNYQGTVTDLLTSQSVGVQPGVWFDLRLEVTGGLQTGSVLISAYLGPVFQGAVWDATNPIRNGFQGLGSFGSDVSFDDVRIGDSWDTRSNDGSGNPTDCTSSGKPSKCMETGQLAVLAPKTDRLWWMHGAKPDFDMWATNGVTNASSNPDSMSSTPWARKGL